MFIALASTKIFFYAPNFEEVEGAYWFRPVGLGGWVGLSVMLAYGQEQLKIGS